MSLVAGSRLGSYEIVGALGAGGMGEVYRARDSKLRREVALKILPAQFAADPDRRARFEREARVLASLNHTHIGQIYGLEDTGDVQALVMELVEGRTLAERIGRTPLPLVAVLGYARQIVLALQAAHDKGVVHRDLKPANIKITPDGVIKVLDFGLAKATGTSNHDESDLTTITGEETRAGIVLGTPAYMSPEQARGQPVDKRTDIWAFGCVVFEMLTGRRAFAGDTVSDTIVSILEREPQWDALPISTPTGLRLLLQRCLEKDPKRRLQDIGDADLEASHSDAASSGRLQESRSPVDGSPGARTWPLKVGVAAVLAAVATGATLYYVLRTPGPVTVPSEYVQLTNYADAAVGPSLSADGLRLTFKRGADAFLSPGQIYTKNVAGGEALQLTSDNERKGGQVFTPDGSRVTYTVALNSPTAAPSSVFRTWTVRADGGDKPAEFLPNSFGLSWVDGQRNLYAEVTAPHFHMPLVVSTPTRAERREIYSPPEEGMVHFAYLSPNQKFVLVVEMDGSHVFTKPCRLVPFEGNSAGAEVGPQGTCTSAAWSPAGDFMYFSVSIAGSSHLWRQRFPNGSPEQITFGPSEEEGVAVGPDGRWLVTSVGTRGSAIWIHDQTGERAVVSEGYAASPRFSQDAGRVFYLLGRDLVLSGSGWAPSSSELKSVDLASGNTVSVLPGLLIRDYELSRDGREVAFTTRNSGEEPQIWLAPLDRRSPPRLIAKNGDRVSFGADGELVFRSLDGTANALVRIRTDGGSPQRLPAPVLDKFGVSPDGQWAIVFSPEAGRDGGAAMAAVPLNGGAPKIICARCGAGWSSDGKSFYVAMEQPTPGTPQGQTVVIPLSPGTVFPALPSAGLASTADAMKLAGARRIDQDLALPGSSADVYLFQRLDLHRNLFKVPLH